MRLEDVTDSIPISVLGGDIDLVKQIQQLLTTHGYLDPPADGKFGGVSNWALSEFAYRKGLSTGQGLTKALARALLDVGSPSLPAIRKRGDWFDDVIAYMDAKEHWICRHPLALNIVYLEGTNLDGTPNDNKPNLFNDVRIVFSIDSTGLPVTQMWDGTTEPGLYWTTHPMSPKGAARIAFGQYKSWVVGTHHPGTAAAHEALVQVEPILVYRDLNKDFKRQGDAVDLGLFAVNQHWGYDAPKDDLGRTSAGCLVGRTRAGHVQFMAKVKSDPRHQANSSYRFMTAVVPGSGVIGH
ncbi:hypothetical protein ABID26_000809 [Mesorhizobium shonense]|uniref:Peptidoglycan binding-like domain-containing protein n=1 Tax=Mesorhizobium shonense TaxID=1209948 RepID=A0ABV2HLI0_9HYPH|nr:MAG: peptidoglycan-binding protein [Mesorhizobium sp.]